MSSRYPTNGQLVDVFNNASTALICLQADGDAVFNAAARILFGKSESIKRAAALLSEQCPPSGELLNHKLGTGLQKYPLAFANVVRLGSEHGERTYIAARPQLNSTLPASAIDRPAEAGLPLAKQWINDVENTKMDHVEDIETLRDFFDHLPVAIHVIAADGTVVAANGRDIALVGAEGDVDEYVGGHIRRIYADQDVVDDFLSRWDSDGPIIHFRADFLNKGEKKPVVIFSTGQVNDNSLVNTRCFVFPDDQPQLPRDEVREVLGV